MRRYTVDPGPIRYIRFDDSLAELKPARYFTGRRILLRELISRQMRLQGCIVEDDFVTNKSMQSLLPLRDGPHLSFLLGMVNSRLLSWYFLQRSNVGHRDDFPKIVLKETRELPIPAPSARETRDGVRYTQEIVDAVDRILNAKRADPAADTSALERDIDQRVYALYGLTPDEVKIVEDSTTDSIAKVSGIPVSPKPRTSGPASTTIAPSRPATPGNPVRDEEKNSILAALDKAGEALGTALLSLKSKIDRRRLEEVLPMLVRQGILKQSGTGSSARYSRG